MYAEGPFYVVHGSIIDGIVQSGLTVRMGGPNEGGYLLGVGSPDLCMDYVAATSGRPCCHEIVVCTFLLERRKMQQ